MRVKMLKLVPILLGMLFFAFLTPYDVNAHNYTVTVTVSEFLIAEITDAPSNHSGTRIHTASGGPVTTSSIVNNDGFCGRGELSSQNLKVGPDDPLAYDHFRFGADKKGNDQFIIFFEEVFGNADKKTAPVCYDTYRIGVSGDLTGDGPTVTTFTHFGCDDSGPKKNECHNESFSRDDEGELFGKVEVEMSDPDPDHS